MPPEHSGNGPPRLAPPVPWGVVREDAPFVSAECVRLGKAHSQCTALREKSLKRDRITPLDFAREDEGQRLLVYKLPLLQLFLLVSSCISSVSGSDVLVAGGFL